ncbi:MAG: hypothetical protein PHR16_01405 [Methylovulum sp.]|nr:hypothetical protein [Methylovulum sp.]
MTTGQQLNDTSAILIGTGLALVSMILIPAFAGRLGLGDSVTGALRIALMKASNKAIKGRS